MLKLVLMINIVNRSIGEDIISFLNENKVPMTLRTLWKRYCDFRNDGLFRHSRKRKVCTF